MRKCCSFLHYMKRFLFKKPICGKAAQYQESTTLSKSNDFRIIADMINQGQKFAGIRLSSVVINNLKCIKMIKLTSFYNEIRGKFLIILNASNKLFLK